MRIIKHRSGVNFCSAMTLSFCLILAGCMRTTTMVGNLGKRVEGGSISFSGREEISLEKLYSVEMTQYHYVSFSYGNYISEVGEKLVERTEMPSVRVSLKPASSEADPIGSKWKQDFSIGKGFTVRLKECESSFVYEQCANNPYSLTVARSYSKWYWYPAQTLKVVTIPFDVAASVSETALTLSVLAIVLPVALMK